MKMNVKGLNTPIPIDSQPWDWTLSHNPLIRENHEPLIKADFYPEKILTSPEYFNQNIDGTLITIYIRKTVYQRLVEASKLLPQGYKFVLLDVWRSNKAQQALFNILKKQLHLLYPNLDEKNLLKKVLTTVAPPSSNMKRPSPHNTGGSVDLTIVNEQGIALKFGTDFDDHTEIARTSYFEEQDKNQMSNEKMEFLNNRRLLFNIMTSVGFTNYTDEWWHYDYGNQNWAWKANQKYAIYGSICPTFTWQNPFQ